MRNRQASVVAITGASAGIGRAAAAAFARRGWRVALLARADEGLASAAAEVERAGGAALAIAVDVADAGAVEAAAGAIEARWGPIDVWVNNAMATVFCTVERSAAADVRRATEVTYLGAVWGTQAALRRMKPRDRGVIVQVGSALAYRSIPLQAAYCGAKSALRGFTDALRCELLHDRSRVRVTMVQLSAFNTPQFQWARTCMPRRPRPLGTVFQPELAGEAIYWAARHRRRELWVGGPAVQAILGQRFFAGLLDRLLARRAYEGQFSPEPLPDAREDNLYRPVPGFGMHGRFDEGALEASDQHSLNTHRAGVAVAMSTLALAVLCGRAWLNRRTRA